MGQHRQLAEQVNATIASFEHLIAIETPANTEALSKARVVLVRSVNAYIAHLGMIVASQRHEVALQRWKEAHMSVVALRARYSEHIGRYTAANIEADWLVYRRGCQDLVVSMRNHLDEVTSWSAID